MATVIEPAPPKDKAAPKPLPDALLRPAVEECHRQFIQDRQAKEFYVEEMDQNDLLYTGRHWSMTGPHGGPLRTPDQQRVRPNSVENVAFALIESLASEFANDVDLTYFPIEPSDEPVAVTMTDIAQFLAYKNHIPLERMKWLRNFFKHGSAIWECVWDPYWRGGRGPNRWEGDVRWRSVHPRNFFPDFRCSDDINTGRRWHKARYVTLEYIRERYPTYGAKVQDDVLDPSLMAPEEVDAGELGKWDMCLLVETWYIGEPLVLPPGETSQGPGLHVVWWCSESSPQYLHHANYAYYDAGEEAESPFVMRQRYPRDGSCWGYGEAWFLKSPQLMLNKTAEIIIEGHQHHAVGTTLYNQGALSKDQTAHVEKYGTLPGMWHEVNDINGIKREYGQGVPASLQNEVTRLQRSMENIVGRFDVSQGRTPGSVTAFRALDLLAQRAQVRLRSADVAVTTSYEDVGRKLNHLVNRFYTEQRAYRILGQDDMNRPAITKRGVFSAGEVQKVFDFTSGETMPLQDFQPPEGAQPGVDFEVYAPEMDVQARTSSPLPSDRTFFLEMAKELYAGQMIDGETFFYVMENGQFPPYEELVQRMTAQQQAQAAAMAGAPAPGGAPPGPPGAPGAPAPAPPGPIPAPMPPGAIPPGGAPPGGQAAGMSALPPDVVDELSQLPPEVLDAILKQVSSGSNGP